MLNQDRVAPGQGFARHAHRDMEIISYVLEGALEHRDSMGNGSQIRPGDVQLMSAGTGVTHSEFNGSDVEPLEFLQIWVLPARQGTPPRYEQKAFNRETQRQQLQLMVSPDGREGSLTIGQDAFMYGGLLPPGGDAEWSLRADRCAWLQLVRGAMQLDNHMLGPGDGAALSQQHPFRFRGVENADFLLFDLPA